MDTQCMLIKKFSKSPKQLTYNIQLGGGAEIGVFCNSICATPNKEGSKPLQDTLQASPSLLQFIIMLRFELTAVEKGWVWNQIWGRIVALRVFQSAYTYICGLFYNYAWDPMFPEMYRRWSWNYNSM